MIWKVIILTLLAVQCQSWGYPPPLRDPIQGEPQSWGIRIFAYGDSRTGFYVLENQENSGQRVHRWLVCKMIQRAQPGEKIPVVFAGDAVYAGGSAPHWENFVETVQLFNKDKEDDDFQFLPAIGNHELVAGFFGIFAPQVVELLGEGFADLQSKSGIELDEWKALLKARGEFLAPREEAKPLNALQLDERTEEAKRLDKRTEEANKTIFPIVDGFVQSQSPSRKEKRGGKIMRDYYVEALKFQHLNEHFDGTKAYYSKKITSADGGQRVRLIVIDTNTLGSRRQKDWFKKELTEDDSDLVIVCGHHPPTKKGKWDWWLPYITGEVSSRAVLWIFAHKHNYEHYFKTDSSALTKRAVFISGGGGASLNDAENPSGTVLPGWRHEPDDKEEGRIYHFLDIRINKEAVYISVVGSTSSGGTVAVIKTHRLELPE